MRIDARSYLPQDKIEKKRGRPVKTFGVVRVARPVNGVAHRYHESGADPLISGFAKAFRPRRRITLSKWAEENMVLSAERAAAPGPYVIGDAAYQRGMMDAVTDPETEEVVLLTSSQVGKTTILTAAQGYYAEHEPSPQLGAFPTQIIADAYLSEQFEPMVRDTPSLSSLFKGLDYPGGYIAFVGANNPSQLAMRPIRVTTGDEVDRWPLSAGREGTPAVLLRKRATTFFNRKHLFASTPLLTKTSEILSMFKLTRQLFYHVVCPSCELKQPLKWDNVHFTKDRETEATYHCEGCGEGWEELTKRRLVRTAEIDGAGWLSPQTDDFYDGYFRQLKPTSKPEPGKVGFWINELYSPWSSMASMAKASTDADGKPMLQQAFRNTREGLPWDGEVSAQADEEQLRSRREVYSPRICPTKAGLITGAVDVQDDRLEILTQAWGLDDESWIMEQHVIYSDPTLPETWKRCSEFLLRRYSHSQSSKSLNIEAVAIDSGGHATQMVYKFAAQAQKMGRPWYAIKGVAGEGKLPWSLSKSKLRENTKLFLVGVDDAKGTVYSRYAQPKPGPGYVHIHEGITDDMIRQMTAEHAVIEVNGHGFPSKVWEKPVGRRNEMLDLMVYNYAARSSINIDMNRRMMSLLAPAKPLDIEAIGRSFS